MAHKCHLTIRFVQKEDNAEQECESPLSDNEILSWEQQRGELGPPTFNSKTKVHDINPDSLTEMTDTRVNRLTQQEGGYKQVLYDDLAHNNEDQPGRSHPRPSCAKRNICVVVTTIIVVVVAVVAVASIIPKIHQADHGLKPLGVDALTDLNEVNLLSCLCLKEDATCKEPDCHLTYTDIPGLERLHQIPTQIYCPRDNEGHLCQDEVPGLGCKLVKCNENERCLEYDQIKEEIEHHTYMCDDTLNCCHAISLVTECSKRNGTNNRTKSLFCNNENEMPKHQCNPGWFGDTCQQPGSRNVTCKCYQSNWLCVNYINCSEMMYVKSVSSMCRKNNLTHCLNETKVCRSQYMEGYQCLCSVKEGVLDDKHLCWRTNAPCHGYSKITHAFPMPVLDRLHKMDPIHPNCNANNDQLDCNANNDQLENCDLRKCNDNKNVDNYDEAEKLLHKMCDITIKCCHVKVYGNRFFNISGNGTHQIANLICENYESDSTPLFQCKQGWGGSRCNETKEIKIDCRCFQHYSLCENITDCSNMMYLDEQKSLCSKHNLTYCELESHICRTNIQGKECLCIIDAHSTEGFISVTSGMKGQQNLMNGAAVLELFNGTSTRNSIVVVILLQIYIHLELLH